MPEDRVLIRRHSFIPSTESQALSLPSSHPLECYIDQSKASIPPRARDGTAPPRTTDLICTRRPKIRGCTFVRPPYFRAGRRRGRARQAGATRPGWRGNRTRAHATRPSPPTWRTASNRRPALYLHGPHAGVGVYEIRYALRLNQPAERGRGEGGGRPTRR